MVLEAGEWTAEFSPVFAWELVQHTAGCDEAPPGTCFNVPDFLHHIDLRAFRFPFEATVGIGKGFDVDLTGVYLLFRREVRYTHLNQSPYTQPFPEIHHPNKTLSGIGDGRAALEWNGVVGRRSLIDLTAFTSVPIGKTGENVMRPEVYTRLHEHIQMGAGTWVPGYEFSLATMPRPWGTSFWVEETFPFYNCRRNGYRPAPTTLVSTGLNRRLTAESQEALQILFSSVGAETWDNQSNTEALAKDSLSVVGRFDAALSRRWRWSIQAQFEFWYRLGLPTPNFQDPYVRAWQPLTISSTLAFGPGD